MQKDHLTFKSILTTLLLVFALATGCASASRVSVVEVTAPPEVRVVEITATPSPAPPQPAAMPDDTPQEPPLALVGGTLIDGTGADPLPDAVLVIHGERILAVGPRAEVTIPPEARVVELEGATMLPGFINTHVHNAYVKHTLRTWAQAGVTTVRDLGAPAGGPHFSIRDRLTENPLHARVIAAGPLVTVPGGYPIAGNDFPSLTVTSPEDARQKISQLIDEGADVIKITLTIDFAPSLSPEEAAAIVETAHERGIPVTVHATHLVDLQRALDAGVDDVAHIVVDHVPDEVIQRMVQTGVSWSPTLDALDGQGSDNLRRFVEAGGIVALSNDAGYLQGLEIGMPMREIELMRAAGMTPMQIVVAATRDAAHVCRRADRLGTLETGKLADVLVVDGDPLADLQALTHVRLVVLGGVIIRDEMSDGRASYCCRGVSPAGTFGPPARDPSSMEARPTRPPRSAHHRGSRCPGCASVRTPRPRPESEYASSRSVACHTRLRSGESLPAAPGLVEVGSG
jgi:imidazolonepropionase-like amidohydrolase